MAQKDSKTLEETSINQDKNPIEFHLKGVMQSLDIIWKNVENLPDQDQAILEQVQNNDTVELIFRNSIILVQGQAGTHKSRLAGTIISALLANNPEKLFLNFRVKESSEKQTKVLYIDTERNLKYQLPSAIKKIIDDAGIKFETAHSVIAPIPLLNVPRVHRLGVVGLLLSNISPKEHTHHCIVIDVVSDCISDFNFLTEVYKLTDGLNMLINNHDVTIICILHENPGSEKARGHLGTELTNKASTILQISEHGNSDTFKISVLKNRNRKRAKHIFVKFNEATSTLELVSDETEIVQLENRHVTKILTILKECTALVTISKKVLFEKIKNELSISERTVQTNIDAIIKKKIPFEGVVVGINYYLKRKRSKEVTFEFEIHNF